MSEIVSPHTFHCHRFSRALGYSPELVAEASAHWRHLTSIDGDPDEAAEVAGILRTCILVAVWGSLDAVPMDLLPDLIPELKAAALKGYGGVVPAALLDLAFIGDEEAGASA